MSHTLRRIGVTILTLGLLLGATGPARASLILNMAEVGGDVVVEGSGTANLSGLFFLGVQTVPGQLCASLALAVVGDNSSLPTDIYGSLSGPSTIGPGTTVFSPTSGTGVHFGLGATGERLGLPAGYVSGTALSGTSVYAGATFASLGVTPGTYVWTWGSGVDADSLTLNIVPEPVSLSLLAVGVASLAVRRWRRAHGVSGQTAVAAPGH